MKKSILFVTYLLFNSLFVYSQKTDNDRANTPPIVNTNLSGGAVQVENDGLRYYGSGRLNIFTPTSSYEKYSLADNGIFTLWDLTGGQGYGFGVNSLGQLEFISDGTYAYSTSATKMIIDDDNGNVGIGVMNPLAKLDVIGGNWDVANGNGDLKIGDATYQFKLGVATGGGGAGDIRMFAKGGTARMIWGSGTTDRMALSSSGYLGLGTIAPSVAIEVEGTTDAASEIYIKGGNSSFPTQRFSRINGTHAAPTALSSGKFLGRIMFDGYNGTSYTSSSSIYCLSSELWSSTAKGSYLTFYTTQNGTNTFSEKLRIDHNGNVGIGTTTPDNKLDVKGIIRAEEVVVETGWADYVFEENYELNELEKVEAFIKENKHLPNVPSAKEIQESGAHVADLMTKMMAKIEELTLYTIKQQKEIDELKRKLDNK